jgi:hypothetical protein
MRLARIALGAVCTLLLLLDTAAAADYSNGGTFLQLGHGARAHALGGGGVAAIRTDAAAYWNPANLAWLKKQNGVTLMHADILPVIDDGYNSISAARGFGPRLGPQSQERRPTRGAYGLFFSHMGFQFDSGKSWSENVLKLAMAFAPNNYTGVGIGVRFLQANNDFDFGNGRGMGLDLALSVQLTERLRGAIVARDLWTRIEWDTDSHEIVRRSFDLGVQYERWDASLILDWVVRQAGTERFIAGLEWNLFDEVLAVRGAMTTLLPGEARTWPSGGVGIHLYGLTVDYAASFDEVDSFDIGQRVSLHLEY